MTTGKRKVLIVDDDADFVESLSSFLEAHQFSVLKARDGRQGLRLARSELPDIILVDIMMGERTEGLFIVQEMRRSPELKDVPIFILSSLYSQIPEIGITPECGWMAHDEFFPKPVDVAQLLEKIRQRIGAAQ